MKTLKEQIQIMTHYLNGGEVELKNGIGQWETVVKPSWDWASYDYRIKEKKQTVTIEKWLVKTSGNVLVVEEKEKGMFDCEDYNEFYTKIKLLDTYEVEL